LYFRNQAILEYLKANGYNESSKAFQQEAGLVGFLVNIYCIFSKGIKKLICANFYWVDFI